MQGNVTLSLATASQGIVGNATIENFTIVPGNNTLPMYAIVDQVKMLSSLNFTTGMVNLTITGTSAVYNGQHLTYYVSLALSHTMIRKPYGTNTMQETALASNVLQLQMNVTQVLIDSAAAAKAANTTTT